MSKAEDILSDFSKILTGRETVIRFRDPIDKGAAAETMRGEKIAVIDISPGLPDDYKFYCWLHECAHVKLHFEQMIPDINAIISRSPRSSTMAAAIRSGEVKADKPRESEADKQAAIWAQEANVKEIWYISKLKWS